MLIQMIVLLSMSMKKLLFKKWDKNMLEMINTGSVELTAPQIIPFSTVTFSTNDNVTGNPTAGIANITTPGFYEITGNFVIEATAEGSVTVNMLADGQAVSRRRRCDRNNNHFKSYSGNT